MSRAPSGLYFPPTDWSKIRGQGPVTALSLPGLCPIEWVLYLEGRRQVCHAGTDYLERRDPWLAWDPWGLRKKSCSAAPSVCKRPMLNTDQHILTFSPITHPGYRDGRCLRTISSLLSENL